jgi:hypothetical protein
MSDSVTHTGKSRKFLKVADGCTALSAFTGNNITVWQMISNGTIYFEEAMLEKGGTCEIEGIIWRETKGTGALQKPNILFIFFKYSDIATLQGNDFAWTANTTKAEVVAVIEIESTDYRDYYSGGFVESSIAYKILTKPIPIKVDEDWQRLFCVPVLLDVGPVNYTENSELDLEVITNQD